MSTQAIPEWIQKRITHDADRMAEVIRRDGRSFWVQLIDELTINTHALRCIAARGRVNALEHSDTHEFTCRIDVFKASRVPGTTYTDLFYRPGDSKFWSRTLEGDSSTYEFLVTSTGVLSVVSNDVYTPQSAKDVAASIVEAMVNKLDGTV